MILPKKLQPLTENEILEEVAEELKIDIKDVKKTYDIWLDYMDYVANETDQCTIRLPHIGRMFVVNSKLREASIEYRKLKKQEIEKVDCKYNLHKLVVPIILKFGVARRNFRKKERDERGRPPFFTSREIIDTQNEYFFKEDKEFIDNEKIKKYFFDENN